MSGSASLDLQKRVVAAIESGMSCIGQLISLGRCRHGDRLDAAGWGGGVAPGIMGGTSHEFRLGSRSGMWSRAAITLSDRVGLPRSPAQLQTGGRRRQPRPSPASDQVASRSGRGRLLLPCEQTGRNSRIKLSAVQCRWWAGHPRDPGQHAGR